MSKEHASGAWFNTAQILEIGASGADEIRKEARSSDKGCFRLCLHDSPENPWQRMIIAACPRYYCRPHRHPGKPSYYQVISGRMRLVLFDDDGRVSRIVNMGTPQDDHSFALHIGADIWHTTIALTEAVFFEFMPGPYGPDTSNVYPAWAPEEDDAPAIARLMRQIEDACK